MSKFDQKTQNKLIKSFLKYIKLFVYKNYFIYLTCNFTYSQKYLFVCIKIKIKIKMFKRFV